MGLTEDPRVERAIRSFARRWGGHDRDNAEQEGRLAVLRLEADRFAPEWGLAVHAARRHLLNLVRRQALDRRRMARHAGAMAPRDAPPGEVLDVPYLLGLLTPRQLRAVRLRLWDGLTIREAAGAMGCAENTVHQHFRAAMERLRRAYP